MNVVRLALLAMGALLIGPLHAAEEFLDRLEDVLTFSAEDTRYRARLSGTLDLEGYSMRLPPPGVIDGTQRQLFIPRLTVFLDAQLGRGAYLFAQARVDRGFDPAPAPLEVRLDEYALRWSPRADGRLTVQVGRFATAVGNWTLRHGSWSNPFITAPVPYEYLTGMWDTDAVRSAATLRQWSHVRPGLAAAIIAREKSQRLPIVWGPSYATGAAVVAEIGSLRFAGEVKAGSLSSRPQAWEHPQEFKTHPTVSGRIGYRAGPAWNFGVSASAGAYLRESAAATLAPGYGRGDHRQLVLAHDVAFAWRHLQVWGEVYASRFEIPLVGDADTLAYYIEAKYKFSPHWFGALRWNEQLFGLIEDRGRRREWGRQVWRVDIAPGYRFTPHMQMKVQYSLQRGDAEGRAFSQLLATQFTLRF